MNMISELRQRVRQHGTATITAEEYDQLQREWITRAGAEDMVAAEREACATVCEDEAQGWRDSDAEGSESLAYEDKALERAAAAIRMRSNAMYTPTSPST